MSRLYGDWEAKICHISKFTTANPTPHQILQKQMFWVDNSTSTGYFHVMLGGSEPFRCQTQLIEKSTLF
jgi:hypothetical protein